MSVTAKLRDGRTATIDGLFNTESTDYPLIGAMEGRSYGDSWALNGKFSLCGNGYDPNDIININEVLAAFNYQLPSLIKRQEPTLAFKCEPKVGDVTVLTKTPDRPITRSQLCTEMFWHIRKNFRSQKEAAVHYGCTDSFVSAVTNGIKPPNKQMLEELGYRKIILYEKV